MENLEDIITEINITLRLGNKWLNEENLASSSHHSPRGIHETVYLPFYPIPKNPRKKKKN